MNWHPKAENWPAFSANGAFEAEYEQFLMWIEGYFNVDKGFCVGNESSSIHRSRSAGTPELLLAVLGAGAGGGGGGGGLLRSKPGAACSIRGSRRIQPAGRQISTPGDEARNALPP